MATDVQKRDAQAERDLEQALGMPCYRQLGTTAWLACRAATMACQRCSTRCSSRPRRACLPLLGQLQAILRTELLEQREDFLLGGQHRGCAARHGVGIELAADAVHDAIHSLTVAAYSTWCAASHTRWEATGPAAIADGKRDGNCPYPTRHGATSGIQKLGENQGSPRLGCVVGRGSRGLLQALAG